MTSKDAATARRAPLRDGGLARARVVVLGLGAALVTLGVGGSLAASTTASARQAMLTSTLQHHVVTTDEYFRKAAAVTALTAHNPAFVDAYADVPPGSAPDVRSLGTDLRAHIDDELSYLETVFPNQVNEACFIDGGGAELARAVTGLIAGVAQLSPDERRNPFFAPTWRLQGGDTVYQAPPYVSPDTNEWVVSNSTVIHDDRARPRALFHFEVTLESLRNRLTPSDARSVVEIVDATGAVLVRSDRPVAVGTSSPGAGHVYRTASWGAEGTLVDGGRELRYQHLPRTAGNANDWYVVVSMPAMPRFWRSASDVGPLALGVGGLALLSLAAVAFVAHGRVLADQITRDDLTGLLNRRSFEAALTDGVDDPGRVSAALLLDLDRFKHVNDTLGHQAGDGLLVDVGDRFALAIGDSGSLYRLGGDEFGVLLRPSDRGSHGRTDGDSDSDDDDDDDDDGSAVDHATRQAHRLIAALEEPFLVDGTWVQIGASIGVCVVREHGTTAASLLRRADVSMYEAKRRRTGVEVFQEAFERRSADGLAFEAAIVRAMSGGEIVLHYQPQVDLGTGRACGVEALVRWQHPEHGLLGPDRFVPAAEETGLIIALTKHVLTLALDQVAAWRAAGTQVRVAVNLAARNVADPTLPSQVEQLLAERGLPAQLLSLELTETDLLGDEQRAALVFAELRRLGVDLAIDDFGTGFASLTQLRRLPFQELKVDRSFVKDITDDPESAHIVRSVLDLAHGLGLKVTAEGIETQACLDLLAELGCDTAQGYLLSRPLPADQALQWIRERGTAPDDRPRVGVPRQSTGPRARSAPPAGATR